MNTYVSNPGFNPNLNIGINPGMNANPSFNTIPGFIPGYSNPITNFGHVTPWSGFTPHFGGLPIGGVPGFGTLPTIPFGYNSPFVGGWNYPNHINPTGGFHFNSPIGNFPGYTGGLTTGTFSPMYSTPWNSTPWNMPFGTIPSFPFNTFNGFFGGVNPIGGYFPNTTGLFNVGGFGWNTPLWNGPINTPGFNGAPNVTPGAYGYTTPFIGQPWGYTPGYVPMNNIPNMQPGVHGNVPFQANQGLCREAA